MHVWFLLQKQLWQQRGMIRHRVSQIQVTLVVANKIIRKRTRDWLITTPSAGSEAAVGLSIAKKSLLSTQQAWQPNGLSISIIIFLIFVL